jgi:hypothetical protein
MGGRGVCVCDILGKIRNAYKILVRKSEEKRPVRRSTHR